MKKLLFAAGWLFYAHSLVLGQVSPVFQNLNFSNCTSGYFWTQTHYNGLPPDGTTFNEASYHDATSLLLNFRTADISPESTLVPEYESLREELNAIRRDEGIIPIVITDMEYQRISEESITNGWIYASPEGLFQQTDAGNIFTTGRAVSLLVDMPEYRRGEMKFRLIASHYLQNSGSFPTEIRIDFADGSGWRTVTPGQIITINYTGQSDEKLIRLEVERDGEIFRSGLKTEVIPCMSDYDDPDPVVPWATTGNPLLPWEISTIMDGVSVYGNAYYLPSGEFDKPFIFVEGVDFEFGTSADRNGSFGWCEFTSGINDDDYPYSMLHRMPELLDAVRTHGYDIILLDFRDGATWIEHNSHLLMHLIQMVNDTKIGTNQLVVAGASMGGQITRYALTTMEHQGIDHCTRLWISLDSPHDGANIPLSLQFIIRDMANRNSNASDFLYNYLRRPAARQMLQLQVGAADNEFYYRNRSEFVEWYATLDQLGFPKYCRNVGVANGNMQGNGLQYPSELHLLEFSCELTDMNPGPEYQIEMYPSPGVYMPIAPFAPSYHVLSRLKYTHPPANTAQSIITLMGLAEMDAFTRIGSPELPPLDYAAGGTRTSLKEFANGASPGFDEGGCNEITDFRAYHCFIPTASALGIKNVSLIQNLKSLLEVDPDASPFDEEYGPLTGNEPHSAISERNFQEILNEILALDNDTGGSLIPVLFTSQNPNGPSFNYGLLPTVQLPNVTIQSGARITINKNIPTHYASSADAMPINSVFRVTTLQDCNSSLVRVSNMGILEIGDPSALRLGELVIGKNASLQLDAGGQVIINPESRLIIDDGGILRINPGSILHNRGAIVVKPGGKIIYGGGVWKLDGTSSKVSLAGGQLQVLPGVTLDFSHNGSMGFLEVTADAQQEILCGAGSVIRLNGTGVDNTILRIQHWANLWNENFNQGHLKLENGRVDLLNNGQIWLDMRLTAQNVHFVDYSSLAGNSTIQVWYNTATFTSCQFINVKLVGQDARCYASSSLFNGALTGMQLNGGLYKVKSCEFRDCGIQSVGLQNPSSVEHSLFIPINGFNNGGISLEDESLTKLSVVSSTFSGAAIAASKGGGTLSLACNDFSENDVAVHAAKGCFVIMDAQSYAGYNHFDNNEQHILLDNAGGLNMSKGYNQFGTFGSMNIAGTIAGIPCPSDCSSPVLDATANIWSPDGSITLPDPNFIQLHSGSFSMQCSSPPAFFYCPIEVVDTNPAGPTTCQEHKLPPSLIKPQKSATITGGHQPEKGESNEGFTLRSGEDNDPGNPLIYSNTFNGIPLDDALVEAASQMEVYDSTANDLTALHLFHEILTSGLDRSQQDIRWKMIWGREQMKTSFEHLVLDDEIDVASNALAFSDPVQRYVDVLNLMTDTVLSDSTYRSQFYLELDKGQLFRTLGRSDIAREVFIHLADCQVDSLEQSVLNKWRAQVESEQAIFEQYVDLGVSPDDVDGAVDSSGFILPVNYIADNYYFGLQINGPESLSFIGCQNEFGFKSISSPQSADFNLYPNPASSQVNLVPHELQGLYTLEILDAMGRKAMTGHVSFEKGSNVLVDLPPSLADGMYIVRLRNDFVTRERLLLIH